MGVGNVEKLLFEDCKFENFTNTPYLLVGTDDFENIEVVRSGEIELRKSNLDECIEAHPAGIASQDKGKNLYWNLKDPTAPPIQKKKTN